MAEYIEREVLIKDVEKSKFYNNHSNALAYATHKHEHDHFLRLIDCQPAADVAPVRHGRWVHDRYENCAEEFEIVKCSNCSTTAYAMAFYVKTGNYCPNCGAKMDGEAKL